VGRESRISSTTAGSSTASSGGSHTTDSSVSRSQAKPSLLQQHPSLAGSSWQAARAGGALPPRAAPPVLRVKALGKASGSGSAASSSQSQATKGAAAAPDASRVGWAASLRNAAKATAVAAVADHKPSSAATVGWSASLREKAAQADSIGHAHDTAADLLGSSVRRLYERQKLKITEDTLPVFTNSDLLEKPTKLDSGVYNTVYAVKLEDSEGHAFDAVFKPLGSHEDGWAAHRMGIPRDDPQIAMRNLATLSYAGRLGLDVIPDTRLGVLSPGQEGAKLGLVMERASGNAAASTTPSVFKRGDVVREVTKLQLLDHLTGQGDRHCGNYFIDVGSDHSAKVRGIDNDQAFGAKLTSPDGIKYVKDTAHIGYRGTSLPPVVDCEMASAIHRLSRGDIRRMLGDKLSEPEVKAALARHQGVTQHLAELSDQGRIISPSQWGHPAVQKLLTVENSYAARDRQYALIMQARARALAQQAAQAGPQQGAPEQGP
jgi:hypothetical protein